MLRIPVEEAQLSHNIFDQQYGGDIFVAWMERSSEIKFTPYYNNVEPADGAHNGRTFKTWVLCYMISFNLLCWWKKTWLFWFYRGLYYPVIWGLEKAIRIPINQPVLLFLLQWCQRETSAHKAQTSSPPEMNVQLNWHWISPIQPCHPKKTENKSTKNKIHGTKSY